jgi:hypothetical protein
MRRVILTGSPALLQRSNILICLGTGDAEHLTPDLAGRETAAADVDIK